MPKYEQDFIKELEKQGFTSEFYIDNKTGKLFKGWCK